VDPLLPFPTKATKTMILSVLFGLLVCCHGWQWDYGVTIDAGSQGSRIYIYQWPHAQSGQRAFITPQPISNGSMAIKPGLSAFAENPSRVGEHLQILIDFAAARIRQFNVSDEQLGTFHLYVKATAGMRTLDSITREAIMLNVRHYISRSPFYYSPTNIRVISGQEEGVNGYISINYARNTLFDANNAVGALDLGGVSVQLTFLPDSNREIIDNYFPLRLRGQTLGLYTHSYLQFGAKAANARILDHQSLRNDSPCHPEGSKWKTSKGDTLKGKADFDKCYTLTRSLLHKDAPCWTRDACSFTSVYQPAIGDKHFVAFGNFAETVLERLQLSADATLVDIAQASRRICSLDMTQLEAKHPNLSHRKLGMYCMHGVWAYTLLKDGFGFPDNTRQLTFEAQSNSQQIGAITYEANQLPWTPGPTDTRPIILQEPPVPLTTLQFWILNGAVVGILVLSLFCSVNIICFLWGKLRNQLMHR
jgi:Golgi nucleoside diphosphatase